MIIIRQYEGPFGDWHGERLCKPKEFLKQVICIERMEVCRYDMIDMTCCAHRMCAFIKKQWGPFVKI